jgi:hypothetical protein
MVHIKFLLIISIFSFPSLSYSQIEFSIFDKADLYSDLELIDSSDISFICKKSKVGSLYNTPFLLKNDYYKYFPENNTLFSFKDSVFNIKSNKGQLKIKQIFLDSLPNGQWLIYDSQNMIRCAYYFSLGIFNSVSYFDADGNIIREILFDENKDLIFDKFYYYNKIMRITSKSKNGYLTNIFDSNGNTLINYYYNLDFIFINGSLYDKLNDNWITVSSRVR